MPLFAELLNQLADALARIYPDHASVRTMATTAGVPVERIPVDDKPLGYWVNLLQEAENRGLTQTLLDRAAADYPVEPRLAAARQAYTAWALPPLPPCDLPDKPFRYLDWYRRADAEVFFGRGRKIRELLDRMTGADSPPIVLLYGQSGVGKSSLLAAGLIPRLESTYAVRYARRDQDQGLLGTLAGALGAVPGDDLRAVWRRLEADGGQPFVQILDQVEEVYTRANPQQPNELADFLDALEGLFADAGSRPRGRLILSFRKEWLAEIKERLAERSLPRGGEVFVERLGRAGIAAVVAGPQSSPRLRAQYGLEVATALPGLIADDLLADRESPVAPMLAILLTDMWDAAKKRSYDHPVFDEDLYHEFRSRGLSLNDFLGRQLGALRTDMPEVVDSGLALDLLAYHTTPLGTAEQRTLADLEQTTYSHRRDVLPGLVQQCQDLYLLVDPARNQPGQPPASRLTHDTLAPHVRKRFDESDAPGQRARRILETRAVEWEAGNEATSLDDADLVIVQNGAVGMRVHTAVESRLVAASLVAQEQRRSDELRIQQELKDSQQRELEQAKQLAKHEASRSRQKTRIIRVLSLIVGFMLLLGVFRLYRHWVFSHSAWQPLAGDNFPSISAPTAIAYARLPGNPPKYLYCVATLSVGVGCSQNGKTWNFYQQGFRTGSSVPGGIGGLSGNIVGIIALAIDKQIPTRMYAYATDSLFYHSTDSGVTWIQNSQALPEDTEVSTFEARDGLVIAVTETQSDERSLYLSTDSGQTWQIQGEGENGLPGSPYDATIWPDGTVYAAVPDGIVQGKQAHGGWSWHMMDRLPGSRFIETVSDVLPDLLVVTYDESSDQGQLWAKSPTGLSAKSEPWSGKPTRFAIDPSYIIQQAGDEPLGYILLESGDVIGVNADGKMEVLPGLQNQLIGGPRDLAVVPAAEAGSRHNWLLMTHSEGLLQHRSPDSTQR